MIRSLLDNDLYKFTMMQLVLHRYSDVSVEYQFVLRREKIDFCPFIARINDAIDHLCTLSLTNDELTYLSQLPYIKTDFIDFLKSFRLQRKYVHIAKNKDFHLTIKGPWVDTILFEVPLLAIINQTYFSDKLADKAFTLGKTKLQEKIRYVREQADENFRFTDFGTRRRFSQQWHDYLIKTLAQELTPQFAGTSNIALAKRFALKPIGTMAHEYIQAFQVLAPNLKESQRSALKIWLKEYQGQLAIALSDTLGQQQFLDDFDKTLATAYDGARHDSGDPFSWGEELIAHYESLGIHPKTKTLIFSDSLTIPKAVAIYQQFKSRINVGFGIGTNLTNDVGPKSLDIVIKMVRCNNQPVAKISNEPAKAICVDDEYLQRLKMMLSLTNRNE